MRKWYTAIVLDYIQVSKMHSVKYTYDGVIKDEPLENKGPKAVQWMFSPNAPELKAQKNSKKRASEAAKESAKKSSVTSSAPAVPSPHAQKTSPQSTTAAASDDAKNGQPAASEQSDAAKNSQQSGNISVSPLVATEGDSSRSCGQDNGKGISSKKRLSSDVLAVPMSEVATTGETTAGSSSKRQHVEGSGDMAAPLPAAPPDAAPKESVIDPYSDSAAASSSSVPQHASAPCAGEPANNGQDEPRTVRKQDGQDDPTLATDAEARRLSIVNAPW